MSYQRDYILRMIEMIAELIAGILGLIKKGEFEKASAAIDQVYYDMLKEDAAFFRNIELDKLTDKLIQEHNYTKDHLEILAELFFVDAELNKAKKEEELALFNYKKSLKLFEFILNDSAIFSIDKQSKISTIEKEIIQLTRN